LVSTKIGNNRPRLLVWIAETRPISGAGSLDSLARAALQENWRDRAVEFLRSREQDLAKRRKQFELETDKKRRKSMRRSVSIAGLAAALVLGTLGFGTGQKTYVTNAQEKTSTMEVKIDNFSFGPATLTVPAGTTVTWTNRDDIPHTVVSTDGVFKSKVLDTDDKFSYTFSKTGTYPYFCSIHPKMTGKIIVQ
jgi:plastocyanin